MRLLLVISTISLVALLFLRPGIAIAKTAPPKTATPSSGQYIRRAVMPKVARNWIPVRSRKVSPIQLKFNIHKDGSVSDIEVCNRNTIPITSEHKVFEAVQKSAPFDPLPPGLPAPVEVKIQFETTTALKLTVSQAIKHYGPPARHSLTQKCTAAGISYPPKRLVLIGLKDERQLLMFGGNGQLKLIGSFPLVTYSGDLGPKLKKGDLQIPEGLYDLTGFQSHNMLALCVNYPNEFDRKKASADHRTDLGTDILIHGGSVSTGCLVVSDDDMEQVFVAVHDVGCKSTKLLIAPCDLTRRAPTVNLAKQPRWLAELYKTLKAEMLTCPMPLNK